MELNNLLKKIRDELSALNLFQDLYNGKIVIGLSGGADSILLYYCLWILSKELKLTLIPLYVNHLIRANSTKESYDLSRYLEDNFNQRLYVISCDVPSFSKRNKVSIEEGGRLVRQRVLREIAQKVGARYIALGHNLQDQIETIIYRLCRGSGLYGLKGMGFLDGSIIRPLLYVKGEEIRDIVKKLGLFYIEDETNKSLDYTRNRIRQNIIPELIKINSSALEHISALSEDVREVSQIIEQEVKKNIEQYPLIRDKDFLILKIPLAEESLLFREVIKYIYSLFKGNSLKIERYHIEEFVRLYKKRASFSLNFPDDIVFEKGFDLLLIRKKNREISLSNQGISNRTISLGDRWGTFIIEGDEKFLADDFKEYRIRTFQPGDKVGEKSLKAIFSKKRIPRFFRGLIPLLAVKEKVIYIPFFDGENYHLSLKGREYKLNFQEGYLYSKIKELCKK